MELKNIGPETETIEYKKSTGELKEAIISIASILNKHKKGVLYFGVKNDGTIIGQVINDESLRKVSQAIGNHITPAIYPEIQVVTFGERECIEVKFEGNRQPYLAYNIPRIRVADEDLVMEQDIYDDMIRKREDTKYSWERQISEYTIEDVDENAFKTYLKKAKDAGRINFEETDIKTVLNKLELTKGDYLLNAGAAVFCDCGINELQMAKFATNERLTFTDIRRFTGSIIDLTKKAEQYIIDAMDWRVEIGNGLYRKEIPEKVMFPSLWETSLKSAEPPLKLCNMIIPPLVTMLEKLFSSSPREEHSEYNMILQFLNEYHTNITLSDICSQFKRSPSYISHMFKKESSMNIREYCNSRKLEDAEKLLISTDMSITEIALDTGFGDSSYFIALFRKKYGISPLKYRKEKGQK